MEACGIVHLRSCGAQGERYGSADASGGSSDDADWALHCRAAARVFRVQACAVRLVACHRDWACKLVSTDDVYDSGAARPYP